MTRRTNASSSYVGGIFRVGVPLAFETTELACPPLPVAVAPLACGELEFIKLCRTGGAGFKCVKFQLAVTSERI